MKAREQPERKRWNTDALCIGETCKQKYQAEININAQLRLDAIQKEIDVEERWNKIKTWITNAAETMLGKKKITKKNNYMTRNAN